MAILIYGQSHLNKNTSRQKANVPKIMYGFINYIATRPGCVLNEGMQHGLFGKILPGDLEYFEDLSKIKRDIYNDSMKGRTHFKAFISLEDENAKEIGISRNDRKGWERYVQSNITQIARDNDIDVQNLSWIAATHLKPGTSHVHIVFWDRSEKSLNYAPATDKRAGKRISEIRKTLIKETFPEKIKQYMEERSIAYHSMRDITGEMIRDFEQNYQLRCLNVDDALADKIGERLSYLKQYIKKDYPDGIPAYNDLSEDLKSEMMSLAKILMNDHPIIRELSNNYISKKIQEDSLFRQYTSLFNPDDSENSKKIDDRITKLMEITQRTIARRVFNSIKSQLKEPAEGETKVNAVGLIKDILNFLKDSKSNARILNSSIRDVLSPELSKQAKKELYLKNKDTGYEKGG